MKMTSFLKRCVHFRLNEANNRDCDYIIAVNFVTFLVLWKIGKYEESKRYADINRKLIEMLLNEENDHNNDSQLSIIMEQSNHNLQNN